MRDLGYKPIIQWVEPREEAETFDLIFNEEHIARYKEAIDKKKKKKKKKIDLKFRQVPPPGVEDIDGNKLAVNNLPQESLEWKMNELVVNGISSAEIHI